MNKRIDPQPSLSKAPTGIAGLDELTNGGLPRRRVTVITGGAGAGKTVLGLQCLVNGAIDREEAGIFVAFEENSVQIKENAAGFAWPGDFESPQGITFVDAELRESLLDDADFDLEGLLEMLEGIIERTGADCVVLDGLDILLRFLPDKMTIRREVFRIRNWMLDMGITGLITAKSTGDDRDPDYNLLQFMADCVVSLDHRLVGPTAVRGIRVSKYRGTDHSANRFAFAITDSGISVSTGTTFAIDHQVSSERVSTGVDRLDKMFNGGYFRGSSILISGAPGTAKTTLAGAFAASACERGEQTLLVSFDEDADQIARNLQSIGIDISPFVDAGTLEMVSLRTRGTSPESHISGIVERARNHGAEALIIDPVSVFSYFEDKHAAENASTRLIDFAKSRGITILSTTLLGTNEPDTETTPIGLSTIADTWIHLSYLNQGGERNRALSIIKSRGMSHSNQVRELLLNDDGISIADVYSGEGEVLMGTLRWEKELKEEREAKSKAREYDLAKKEAELALEELELEMETLRQEQQKKKLEIQDLAKSKEEQLAEFDSLREARSRRRSANESDE
ncbi:MAG: circadian clock protein KaiC [Myxococcota bacterium]